MRKYNAYHTNVKVCYSLGVEKQLLPKDFTRTIPTSTADYWKKTAPENCLGTEYSQVVNQSIEDLQVMCDQKVRQMRKTFVAFCRLYLTILDLVGEREFKSIIRQNKKTIVNLIEQTSKPFGGREMVCRFLRISPHTFQTWKRYLDYSCPMSPLNLCFKRVPNQISHKEISVLKKYMTSRRYLHWSTASVWGLAFKNRKTTMSRATWYSNSKRLNLTQPRKAYRKKRKRISFRAEQANQTWHMDVSVYKTMDNFKYYIYTVVDNFSRKIVAYDVSNEISAKTRLKSLKQAIRNEFGVDIGNQSLELIVDGGSENNNHTINDFIRQSQIAIDKKIALKDVVFSNSIVEGVFKIMKQKYFQDRQILSTTIYDEVDFFVRDYNELRPHYTHGLYTPSEIHDNPGLKDINFKLRTANRQRIKANQKARCIHNC